MFKRLKQLKKLWKLTNKDTDYLNVIDNLTDKDIKDIPNKGNGKAVFLKYMTPKERDEYLLNKQPVWKKFNDKLKEIIK